MLSVLLLAGGAIRARLFGRTPSTSLAARSGAADKLLETAPDAMVVVDLDGCVRNVNQLGLDLFGYSREQLLGQPVESLVPERFRGAHVADRTRFAQQPERRDMGSGRELFGRRADGSEFPIEISLIPVQLEDGLLISSAIRDIGPRLAGEKRFRDLLEAAPDAMVIADTEGRIELVNAQTEQLFGYQRSELVGQPVEMLLPEGLRQRHRGHVLSYLEAPRPIAMGGDRILVALRKDGSEIPVEISLSPIYTEKGLLLSAAVRNASARHVVETSLRAAARTLEQRVQERTRELADRARELARSNAELEEFVYAVSHDLKSPLRGISSLAEWLHEDCAERLTDKEKETLELLRSRVARMHQVIDGALDFARTTGAANAKVFETERAVREARDVVDPDRTCDLRIDGELPSIRYDEAQLTRVFQNLIGNAIQHGGGPGSTVAVACARVGADWEFCVRDCGPGVAREHRERIFRMFQKLGSDPHSTGIGLAVVKKIVESNGGVVGVRDAPERGAEFFFTVQAS